MGVFFTSTARCSGKSLRHVVSLRWMLSSLEDSSPGLESKLLSVYIVLRISLKMTESWHRCRNVEILYAGEPR
jgi:hypothetical protein